MFLNAFFTGLFKTIVFRSLASATKTLLAILDFFHRPDFFHPVPYPVNQKKYFFLTNLNYYLLKFTKFHGDSVKNKSARTKKPQVWGGAPNAPSPSQFRVNYLLLAERKMNWSRI